MKAVAKISPSGEVAIPPEVCAVLSVKSGDTVEWKVTGEGRIEVTRVSPLDWEYLKSLESTLSEWSSPEDEEAFGES